MRTYTKGDKATQARLQMAAAFVPRLMRADACACGAGI